MKKWIVIGVLIVAAGGGGYFFWHTRKAKADAAASETEIVAVSRGTIAQAVASTGRVVSNLDVDIKCKASGEIVTLPYDISAAVKQGDLLLELDPINQQRAVLQAEAALAQSQAKLDQARQNVLVAEETLSASRSRADANLQSATAKARDARAKANYRKELLDQHLETPENYSTYETEAVQAETDLRSAQVAVEELKVQELGLEVKRLDVKLSEAAVQADQVALANARQTFQDTKITAPMDGVVAALNVQKGMIISSGITNVGGGTTIMTLADLSRIFVLAAVDESDIGGVALEQSVVITADAYSGRRFRGKVVRIATRGVNVTNVVTFEVKIEVLDEQKSLLKPEMTANVQIIAAETEDALLVPMQAITRKDGKLVALVAKSGGPPEERPVEIGLSDGEHYEVTQGLHEGDLVVVSKDDVQSRWRAGQGRRPMTMMPGIRPPASTGGRR